MPSLSERFPNRTLLHRGDLALSYRARDTVLDRDVFIKVLNPALAKDAEIRARFEREAKAVAKLDHPNLVRIYEYGEDADEGLYMLLEWVDGTNLADYLKSREKLSGDELMLLARELLSGLCALHSLGIVHRDLKPENVLVKNSAGGIQYKITDFSLARLKDAPVLTHHEAIIGTPAYMAPEQAAGAAPTEASDLFSLGVVLYEAATGSNPLIGETMLDTLRRIRESDISFTHSAILRLPAAARALLEQLLKKNPADRAKSAKIALAMLDGGAIWNNHTRANSRRNIYYLSAAVIVIVVGIWLIRFHKNGDSGQMKAPASAGINDRLQAADTASETIPEFREGIRADDDSMRIAAEEIAKDAGLSKTSGAAANNNPSNKDINKLPAEIKQSIPSIVSSPTTTIHIPDSIDFMLTTEPWAHVLWNGRQLGTTPLESPLRLPAGEQEIILKNPAFPPIELPVGLNQSAQMHVKLADYVSQLILNVEPWGEIAVDGESVGATPLAKPLYVSPGQHTIRVSHPTLVSLSREIDTGAGDVITAKINLTAGTFHLNGENGQ